MTFSDYQNLFQGFLFDHPHIQSNLEITQENGTIIFSVRVSGVNEEISVTDIMSYPNDVFGPVMSLLSTFSTENEDGWIIPLFDISTHTPELFKIYDQENNQVSSFSYRWENGITYWELM